jgi:hypothetical protein
MGVIVVPIVVLSIILASANYRSMIQGIENAQIQTTSDYVVRSRIWFRGTLRTMVNLVSNIAVVEEKSDACNNLANKTLGLIDDFIAIKIRFSSGVQCFSNKNPNIKFSDLTQIIESERTKPPFKILRGTIFANSRYDAVRLDGKQHLVVYANTLTNTSGETWEAVLLINPDLLDMAFEIGTIEGDTKVAFMKRGGDVIVAKGVNENDLSWLPSREAFDEKPLRWDDKAKDGASYSYVSQSFLEPDLYVLARFENDLKNAAWMQFLILILSPSITLILLFISYAHAIQRSVLQWIARIEFATKQRHIAQGAGAIIPLDAAMPDDIRSVAEAYNHMIEDGRKREDALSQALQANHFLNRELHHRLKNSLQVIQSYLALSRRQQSGARSIHLAETEAKILVLSIAYRLALSGGNMQPVSIKAFAEEIISNISAHEYIYISYSYMFASGRMFFAFFSLKSR